MEELEIEPDAPATLRALKDAGYLLFVVTNQPDVRRGLMSAETLETLHARLAEILPVDEIAACLHDNADHCACRKPKPGLVLDLAARRGVDLRRSWLIGDQDRDIACGKAAGCNTILLVRDYNLGTDTGADQVVETLSQSLAYILKRP